MSINRQYWIYWYCYYELISQKLALILRNEIEKYYRYEQFTVHQNTEQLRNELHDGEKRCILIIIWEKSKTLYNVIKDQTTFQYWPQYPDLHEYIFKLKTCHYFNNQDDCFIILVFVIVTPLVNWTRFFKHNININKSQTLLFNEDIILNDV